MILLIHIVALVSSISFELSNISRIKYKIMETITHIFFVVIILNVKPDTLNYLF